MQHISLLPLPTPRCYCADERRRMPDKKSSQQAYLLQSNEWLSHVVNPDKNIPSGTISSPFTSFALAISKAASVHAIVSHTVAFARCSPGQILEQDFFINTQIRSGKIERAVLFRSTFVRTQKRWRGDHPREGCRLSSLLCLSYAYLGTDWG